MDAEFPSITTLYAVYGGAAPCQPDAYTRIEEEHGAPGVPYSVHTAPCVRNGTYWIRVMPQGGSAVRCGSDYTVSVQCASCDPCVVSCAGTPETEPCGEQLNGGCTSPPMFFPVISTNQAYCGTLWADHGQRDSDWFQFALSGTASVSIDYNTEIPIEAWVFPPTDCNNLTGYPARILPCAARTVAYPLLETGNYWFVVLPDNGAAIFDGYPCAGSPSGAGWKYEFQINADVLGACCFDVTGICHNEYPERQCLAEGGYFAANQICANLVPTCGAGRGACCRDDDTCIISTAGTCLAGLVPCACDANCDGARNFADIPLLVLAQDDFEAWKRLLPNCPPENVDVNGDGVVNQEDVLLCNLQHGPCPTPRSNVWRGRGSTCEECR